MMPLFFLHSFCPFFLSSAQRCISCISWHQDIVANGSFEFMKNLLYIVIIDFFIDLVILGNMILLITGIMSNILMNIKNCLKSHEALILPV